MDVKIFKDRGYEDIGRLDRIDQYCRRDDGSSEECKAYKILTSLNECIRSAANYDTIRRCPSNIRSFKANNFETGKLWKNKHIQSLRGQIAVSCGSGKPRFIPRGRAHSEDFFLEARQKLARCSYPIIQGFGTEFNCESRTRSGNFEESGGFQRSQQGQGQQGGQGQKIKSVMIYQSCLNFSLSIILSSPRRQNSRKSRNPLEISKLKHDQYKSFIRSL